MGASKQKSKVPGQEKNLEQSRDGKINIMLMHERCCWRFVAFMPLQCLFRQQSELSFLDKMRVVAPSGVGARHPIVLAHLSPLWN